MDCHTLEELKAYFEVKLTSLTTCMDLVSIASEPYGVRSECRDQLNRMESDLCDAESTVAQLKEWVAEQRQQLQAAKELHENLRELNSRLHHTEGHLPERLPTRHIHIHTQQSEESHQRPLQPKPVTENQSQKKRAGSSTSNKPYKPPPAPLMDYVTVPEFEDTPKYMKGRITYDSVNALVEGYNTAIESKYRLMKRPKSGLSDKDRKQYHKYKEQENKDTKGAHFVTESDLKARGNLKMDSTSRAVLTILRHCGRLREVRGGGITRFVINH